MSFLTKAALVLTLCGALAIAGWHQASHWRPPVARYPSQGVDIGDAPDPIEWGFVRVAGADFAYLAATVGADRRVPSFEANWNALPAAGMRRGAVHLYSLCQPAVAQANAFNTTVPRSHDALPAAVDVTFRDDCAARPDAPALVRDLRQFLTMVEAHTGHPVLLRIAAPVERRYDLTAAIDRPVWAMADFIAPDYAARPWRLWRASDMRRIDGIEDPLNWNVTAR